MSLYKPQQRPHFIGTLPTEDMGPRALPITLVFTAGITSIGDDLALENENGTISAVQTVYIDNSQNQAPFGLTLNDTGQNITVPPYYQGYWPILCWQNVAYTAISYFPCAVKLVFLNTYVEPYSWNTQFGAALGTPFVISNVQSNAASNVTVPALYGRQTWITSISMIVSAASTTILAVPYIQHISSAGLDTTYNYIVSAAANIAPDPIIDTHSPPMLGMPGIAVVLTVPAMGLGSSQVATVSGYYL